MKVRRASPADLGDLRDLLQGVGLPVSDLSLDCGPFLLVEAEGRIVACAGLEQHAAVGLLRSVAVVPAFAGRGLAVRLCCEILQAARGLGMQQVYLLTLSASGFFEKLGFAPIPRSAAPEAIRATREFRELCPDTSVLMHRAVPDDSTSRLVGRLRDAYAAFVHGDPAALLALLTSATVYHLPGAHLGGGRLEGRDAIVQRLAATMVAYDSAPQVELLEAFGDDTLVVTGERLRARRRDRVLDQRVDVVWRFERAKCVDIWAHFEDQRACDAFWDGWAAPQGVEGEGWMIRELRGDDAEAYAELRRQALLESPLAFASSPADDLAASPEAVREQLRGAPESVIIGAFQPSLVGAVGLYRDRHLKSAHKAHLWGMYVAPSHRRHGIASALLEAVLRHAAALPGVCWVHLSVSSAAPGAQRLYERAGFRVWGTEPDALRHEGQTVVERHMALCLGSGAQPGKASDPDC